MKYFSLRRLLAILTVALVGLAASGCGDSLASFTFTEDSQEVVVQGSALGQLPVDNPFGEALKLNINLDQQLEAHDATGASGVFLQGLELRITDTKQPEGDTDNFDFLDSLKIYASADGMDRKLVAEISDVPQGKQKISLDTKDNVDLKPYVEKGMKLAAEAQGSPPDDDTSLKAVATVRVEIL